MKKDIFWNSVGTAAWSFLSLFLLIIVTRVNGIIDSGQFSFGFALALIMYTIVSYGGRAYQVSDHKNLFTAESYISLRILTSLAVIIFTAFFVSVNNYSSQKLILIFLLVGQRVFDAIADVFYGIMQKKHHLYISGKSLFYKSLLSLIAFLFIELLTKELLLSALVLPIISLLFIIFYDIPNSRRLEIFSIKPKFTEMKDILKSTFLPFAITLMGLIFVNLARYFIDIYHPALQRYFGIAYFGRETQSEFQRFFFDNIIPVCQSVRVKPVSRPEFSIRRKTCIVKYYRFIHGTFAVDCQWSIK